MPGQEFCDFLEYKMNDAFKHTDNEKLRGFWCDGVLLPSGENEYSKKQVNDRRYIIMTAFAGKDGQDKYELVLQFGPKSLSKYARDLNLEDCLPAGNDSWLDVDQANNKITVRFN